MTASAAETEAWFKCDADIQFITQGSITLARGAFGEISLAIDLERKDLVVVKTITQALAGGFGVTRKLLTQEVCNETMALRTLSSHVNIVDFVGLTTNASNPMMQSALCLCFKYCPVDLHTVLQRNASLSFDMIRFVAEEILSALSHCHLNGIIHRDVTPKNLLVSNQGRIQLCDFGLAKACPHLLDPSIPVPQEDSSKAVCTLWYRPPEILLGGPAVEPSVDMYSFGLVLAEMIASRPLLRGRSVLDQLHQIFSMFGTPSIDDDWVGPDFTKVQFHSYEAQPLENALPRADECPHLLSLLSQLLRMRPKDRMTADSALSHEFCKESSLIKSAVELIPTELKSVAFVDSSLEMLEQEALSLSRIRRSKKRPKATPKKLQDVM